MRILSTEPEVIGTVYVQSPELQYVLYMPIKMAYIDRIAIPSHLKWCEPLVDCVIRSEGHALVAKYIYITSKCAVLPPNQLQGRPGWHSDDFKGDDVNYLWSNIKQTEFCVQEFDISEDCDKSMIELDAQALDSNIVTYDPYSLVRITQRNIHRESIIPELVIRNFVKISVSMNPYNLKGNAHNYLLDYDWEMYDRTTGRNHAFREPSTNPTPRQD